MYPINVNFVREIGKYIHEMMEEVHQSLTKVMKMRKKNNCFSLVYYLCF